MDYYRRMLYESDTPAQEPEVPEEAYLDRMQKILSAPPCIGVPPEPTAVLGTVYLGTSSNAENLSFIKKFGIKYLLNCGGSGSSVRFQRAKDYYTSDTGVMGYQELIMDDTEGTSARAYFEKAHSFLDYARSQNAKALIYCPGVSRGGVIALSFMLRHGVPLLEATKQLKDRRRCLLTNDAFMTQLVRYAREVHMLDQDLAVVRAPTYGRRIDRYRINRAYLPLFM